jgi:hypothetical protein
MKSSGCFAPNTPILMWDGTTKMSQDICIGDEVICFDLQSKQMGLAYYVRVGIPAILSKGDHDQHPVELDCIRRAFLYFNQRDTLFKNDRYLSDSLGWDFFYNPFLVLDYLPKVAKAGIITMPSLLTELSRLEGYGWIGYHHHRYLFTERDNQILIVPKLTILEAIVKESIIYEPEVQEVQFRWSGHNIPYFYMWNMGVGSDSVIRELQKLIEDEKLLFKELQ